MMCFGWAYLMRDAAQALHYVAEGHTDLNVAWARDLSEALELLAKKTEHEEKKVKEARVLSAESVKVLKLAKEILSLQSSYDGEMAVVILTREYGATVEEYLEAERIVDAAKRNLEIELDRKIGEKSRKSE